MAGRLSFSIAINLLTENFKRGASSVKSALRSMQMQVLTFAAAMGAGGLGLSNFVSRLIDTARETNRVTTALKNVSGSAAQFAGNQRFLLDMAKKYGLEINALTGAYAQFTAAASVSGMSMENQRKVFESVSRATTAFGMSAEDSKGVFLALSQMMSKGKISSEELRLQMGERLPIALQAMAKAAGTSVAGLDKLLKQGKLMSADVLPRFAEALNEMIPNIDTDNLETSINRLKNTFTEFTKNTGIQGYYKQLVDRITEFVKYGANNIRSILYQLSAVITGVILGRLFKWIATELAKAQRAAMLTASRTAKAAGQAFDEIAWKAQSGAATIKTAFKRAGAAIRTALMSALPTAIFTGITMLIAHLINLREEAKRIKSIFSDYKKDAAGIGIPEDADRLKRLYKIATDTSEAYNVRKNALAQINEMLGTSYSINQKSLGINGDINTKIAERIKLLKDAAAVEFYQQRKLEEETYFRKTLSKYGGTKEGFNIAVRAAQNGTTLKGGGFDYGDYRDAQKDAKEWNEHIKNWQDASKQLSYFDKEAFSNPSNGNAGTPTPEKDKELKKAEQKYIDTKKEYTNQLSNGALKEKEYNSLIDKLNKDTYKELSGLLSKKDASKNKIFQETKQGKENPLLGKTGEIANEYWQEMNKLAGQYALNLLSEKEYNNGIVELTEKALKAVGSLEEIDDAGIEFVNSLEAKKTEMFSRITLPKEEKRDTTFDYKLKKTERIAADKSNKEKYVSNLKSLAGKNADSLSKDIKAAQLNLNELKKKYSDLAPVLVEELNNALANVDSLEDALKIAEVQQDIKDLNKEINKGLYAGVKDIAGSADRVVSAFSNLKDVFNDVDSSGWERIMAVWNAITQTVDSFLSILNMIETLTTLTQQLTKAKEAEAVVDGVTTQQKVANDLKEAASSTAAAGVVANNNARDVAGNTAAAASGAAKSVAGIPLVGWIMAGAAVASIIALMATLPKFAKGGIVGGTSGTGDKLLARVNSGEMILTQSQQATLFQLANGKGLNTNGSSGKEVVFRIEGDTLVGVLNNYNRRRRRI